MNKRLALVSLIKGSFLLSPDVKISLLKGLAELPEEDVITLGAYLSAERDFVIANGQKIQDYAETLVDYFASNPAGAKTDKVFVGSGKPS